MEKNKKSAGRIVPVILAGGSGSRLWPLSRASQPKQFLPLMEADSLLIATCRRFAAPLQFDQPVIICNSEHHDLVERQLRQAGIVPKAIILEPLARGTAAAAALAAQFVERENPGSTVLLLAADNYLQRPAAFLEGVALGARAADIGQIVLFGVAPTYAESGFGYIEIGDAVDAVPGVCRVRAFVEKPGRDQAESLLKLGGHLWNSGNLLFRSDVLLSEFDRLRPDILAACRAALDRATLFANGVQLEKSSLSVLRVEVLDRAILERTDRAAVVAIDAGWSDVGTWESVWNSSAKDADANSLAGDVVVDGVTGCYIRSESRLVVAVDLTDLVVIETADAVLVARRGGAAETKALVERLLQQGRPEVVSHPLGSGNWGRVQRIDEGSEFSVHRIELKPGAEVSRRVGYGRAEHWVVAQGTACVALGNERRQLQQSESILLQAGAVYQLQNTANVPLQLIEIQTSGGSSDLQ